MEQCSPRLMDKVREPLRLKHYCRARDAESRYFRTPSRVKRDWMRGAQNKIARSSRTRDSIFSLCW